MHTDWWAEFFSNSDRKKEEWNDILADKILDFKVLYLDSYFYSLQRHLEYFYFQRDLNSTPLERFKKDKKISIDLVTKYEHLKFYAQNVLTHYQ